MPKFTHAEDNVQGVPATEGMVLLQFTLCVQVIYKKTNVNFT